jgi:aminotransferase
MTDLGFKVIKPDGAFISLPKYLPEYNQIHLVFLQDFAKKKAVAFIQVQLSVNTGKGMYVFLMRQVWKQFKQLARLKEYLKENGTN